MIDGWLRDDLDGPRKQRHTAKRIVDRLLVEHDAQGVVSYGMARDYVATRRREIRIEVGREPASTFIETGTDSYRLAHTTRRLAERP